MVQSYRTKYYQLTNRTIKIAYTLALSCLSMTTVAGASLTPKYAMLAGNSSVEFDFSAATLDHTQNFQEIYQKL